MRIQKIIMVLLVIGFLGITGIVHAGDVTLGGKYDIQYRTGESYKALGQDRFVINALYLTVKAGLGENVDSKFIIDGADLAKETTAASHKYIDEANIIIKNIANAPLTVVFGKDEMPYGQDYDKMLFDPIVHSLEIDKVWGLNARYKCSDTMKIEAGIWEQDGAGDVGIYENYTARLILTKGDWMTKKISFANIANAGGDDELRVSVGMVCKKDKFVVHAEYTGFEKPSTKLAGYALGRNAMMVSYGIDYELCKNWKVKVRHEYLEDDSSADTILGMFNAGLDYKIGDKTSLMLEYQNLIGEGSVKDKSDINAGIMAKF